MNLIERKIYTNKIKPYINKNIIKVIVGQRRIGKSCFLQWLSQYYKSNFPNNSTVYINMEDIDFEHITDYKKLVSYVEQNKKTNAKSAIFIDEIQEIEQFEKALRHFQTSGKWDIYCTGSNAALLSGELATLLSGRYIEIKMYGLSYNEFLIFHQQEDTPKSFQNYLKFGGLPFLINLEFQEKIIFDFLKNIYTTILFKDIIARYSIRNVSFLEKLCRFVADNIGNLLSARKISNFLKSQNMKISTNIVLDYLTYLSNAFFIFQVRRFDIKGKRILEVSEKYYIEDLGIRHSLIGFKMNDMAQILENIVFMHLLINDYDVMTGKLGDKEIDFICDRHDKRTYIQVTLSLADEKVKQREYGNLLEISDNYRKIVVTADEYIDTEYKGIETINIRKFLREF